MFNPDFCSRQMRSCKPTHWQSQHGASLIELLIGLSVGLIVIASAIVALEMSRATAASISDLSQLQQQASYALRIIGTQVRQAGSIEPIQGLGNELYSFSEAPGTALVTSAVTGSDGIGSGTDSVSVSYQPAAKDSQGRDCLGELIQGFRAEGTFFVKNTELRCKTAGKNQPLIGNVADFKVAYRVRSALGDTQRMTAAQVEKSQLWASVKSLEVCLHLVGNVVGHANATPFTGCQNELTSRNGRLHLVFHNVFDLRSQGS